MIYAVDQNLFSLASCELDFASIKVMGGGDPSVEEELPDIMEYGTGNLPCGRVTGQWKGSGEIDMLVVEFDQLVQSLGDGYGQVNFNIGATYMEILGDGVWTLQITGCRINKQSLSNSVGKASRIKVPYTYTEPATWNGVRIFAPNSNLIGAVFAAILG